MEVTGIMRRIDNPGRIMIPEEIRRTTLIREGLKDDMFNCRIVPVPRRSCQCLLIINTKKCFPSPKL